MNAQDVNIVMKTLSDMYPREGESERVYNLIDRMVYIMNKYDWKLIQSRQNNYKDRNFDQVRFNS